MDGNGRWAQLRGRPRTFGHIKGARVAKKVISACAEMGIENLTLYAFSTENWLRPEQEVAFLMRLLGRYLKRETENLLAENIRFSVIGNVASLPKEMRTVVQDTISATQHCTGMRLIFALSYGSRQEIVATTKALALKVQNGELEVSDIDESLFSMNLSTHPAPDLDLMIRTSGEQRVSNFLLWQSAYSELYFTRTLWPDFNRTELEQIFAYFLSRERRFGQVTEQYEQPSH